MTCCVFLSMVVSLQRPTICFWVITSTEANNLLRLLRYSFVTKSSTPRTSSCWEATTSAPRLIVFMAFMMNANAAILLNSGKSFLMSLTVCQFVHLLTKKSSACTVDSALNSKTLNLLKTLWDQLMYLIKVYCVTCCGLTQKEVSRNSAKTIEVLATRLVRTWCVSSRSSTTSTWFAELIKLWRMGTNSFRAANLSPCSRPLTIVESSIIQAHSCPLTIHSCVVFRSWSPLISARILDKHTWQMQTEEL